MYFQRFKQRVSHAGKAIGRHAATVGKAALVLAAAAALHHHRPRREQRVHGDNEGNMAWYIAHQGLKKR